MYYSLRGTLIYTDGFSAAVECGGVGYLCSITTQTYVALPPVGQEVMLYTHLSVREDAMELYGFASEEERTCFRTLTSVSGVGAKVGIAILSVLTSDQVAFAIMSGDDKTLTAAPGVGKKLAQRIVLELKDKFKGSTSEFTSGAASTAAQLQVNGNIGEAMSALFTLGYTQAEVTFALGGCSPDASVEELIRMALKALANR